MRSIRSRDGTLIAYQRTGTGLPVIVVNGALSEKSATGPLASFLSERFSVFAYDRRGRGESGDVQPYAVRREVEDLQAVIGEAGGEAFVIGHSSGAVLALEAAARGLPIMKLALYEPPFIVDRSRPSPPEDYAAQMAALLSAGRRGDAVEYFMKTGPEIPAVVIAQLRRSPMWPSFERMAHTLLYDIALMGDAMSGEPISAERWSGARMPVLVMVGGSSPQWAHNSAKALARALPNAQARVLEGQEHGAAPEALAPVLAEFFGD